LVRKIRFPLSFIKYHIPFNTKNIYYVEVPVDYVDVAFGYVDLFCEPVKKGKG
jgi:hypothetical protein